MLEPPLRSVQHFRGPKVLFSQAGSLRSAAVMPGPVQILLYLDTRRGNFVPDTGAKSGGKMHSSNEKLRFRGWWNSKGGDLEPPRPWELYQEYFSWYKESETRGTVYKMCGRTLVINFHTVLQIWSKSNWSSAKSIQTNIPFASCTVQKGLVQTATFSYKYIYVVSKAPRILYKSARIDRNGLHSICCSTKQ